MSNLTQAIKTDVLNDFKILINSQKPKTKITPIKKKVSKPIFKNSAPKNNSMPAPIGKTILREVTLIYSDVQFNNNKIWKGILYSDGEVYTEWGRVGKAMQTKIYPQGGDKQLTSKEKEKLKKGYTVARVVGSINSPANPKAISNLSLQDIAIKQISQGEPILTRLVTMLVKANIHQITSQSQITYNSSTGLFQTPLGVVTADAISEAYYELDLIAQALNTGQLTSSQNLRRVSQYLRLIPQDFGMKLDINVMFPNQGAIQKQKALLDSLEASYNTILAAKNTTPSAKPDTKSDQEEKVFEINVKLCDPSEIKRITKLYEKTRKSMHRYVAGMTVKNAYDIEMPTQRQRFETKGRQLGDVRELWHGTKLANVLNILRIGLNITPPKGTSLAGAMYGPGLYFSSESTKSLNYATDYWHGGGTGKDNTYFMFLANVAMGKYMIPKSSTSKRPPVGYNSYWARAGQSGVMNHEMIVPTEDQFDLIRLVEFS